MKKVNYFVLACLFIALLFAGCGKVPQTEINAANYAIAEAKTAQAEVYVPEEYSALQDSLKIVMENIEQQKSKLFKRFYASKQQLIAVTALATTVKNDAEDRKQSVQEENKTILDEISNITEENNLLIKKTQSLGQSGASINAIKIDILSITTSVAESDSLSSNGNFMQANFKIKAAKAKAVAINNELKTLIEKSKG